MSDQLISNAYFQIQSGKIDAFKDITTKCISIVKEKDSGTLQYDWYYNEAGTNCVVLEIYKDSDALLEHIEHVGPVLGALLEISSFSAEILGNVSSGLKRNLAAFNVKYYSYYSGL